MLQPPARPISPGSSAQSLSSQIVTSKYVLMFSGLPGAYFLESVLVFALRATFPVLFNRIILILSGRGMQIGELLKYNLLSCNHSVGGPGNVVGIATSYGLDDPGIESRWGVARFSAPLQTGHGAHPVSCTMGTGCFPG
jgi:hypothetical protein